MQGSAQSDAAGRNDVKSLRQKKIAILPTPLKATEPASGHFSCHGMYQGRITGSAATTLLRRGSAGRSIRIQIQICQLFCAAYVISLGHTIAYDR